MNKGKEKEKGGGGAPALRVRKQTEKGKKGLRREMGPIRCLETSVLNQPTTEEFK